MENESTPQVPSIGTLVKVVLYLAFIIAIGVSFSFSLGLLNTAFALGAALTLANIFMCLMFFRYLVISHRHIVAKFFN